MEFWREITFWLALHEITYSNQNKLEKTKHYYYYYLMALSKSQYFLFFFFFFNSQLWIHQRSLAFHFNSVSNHKGSNPINPNPKYRRICCYFFPLHTDWPTYFTHSCTSTQGTRDSRSPWEGAELLLGHLEVSALNTVQPSQQSTLLTLERSSMRSFLPS